MPAVTSHNYPEFEEVAREYGVSSATSFQTKNTRIVSTSGCIGDDKGGSHAHQFDLALANIEKSLAAASPHLVPAELWAGVYNITSFHVGGAAAGAEQKEMAAALRKYTGGHQPSWTAVGAASLLVPGALVEMHVQAAYEES